MAEERGRLTIRGTYPSTDVSVLIDGVLVPHLAAFTLRAKGPHEPLRLTLEIDVWDVEVEADAVVEYVKHLQTESV